VAPEENKAIIRRIVEEVVNGKNLALADELFSSEYVTRPSLPAGLRGPEKAKRQFAGMHETFPDIQANIEAMVAEGDMVATRMTLSGTHQRTGRPVRWPLTLFSRFAEGKVVEDWPVADTAQIEAQLG
jgi:predicted ester cyclase